MYVKGYRKVNNTKLTTDNFINYDDNSNTNNDDMNADSRDNDEGNTDIEDVYNDNKNYDIVIIKELY